MDRKSFTGEYIFKASPTIVYKFLTTPDCLTRWFCDDCNRVDGRYYFEWEGAEEIADILEETENEHIRLQWEEYEDEYLEFKVDRSEVTGDTIIFLTAFCDDDEVEEELELWESQMNNLRRAMGA